MKYCVLRGGSFNYDSWSLRTSDRPGDVPELRRWNYGFLLVVISGKT